MPTTLQIGRTTFILADQPAPDEVFATLLDAFQQGRAVPVNVMSGESVVNVIVNPAVIPWVALNQEGTSIGFHFG